MSDIFRKNLPFYPQAAFVEILGAAGRVFNLLAEDERQLKQEQVSVPPLSYQRLGLPNQEGVLQEELSLHLHAVLQTWRVTDRGGQRRYDRSAAVRLLILCFTFQHADVHGVVCSLRDAQHHVQAFLYLALAFLAAGQQLLHKSTFLFAPNVQKRLSNDLQDSAMLIFSLCSIWNSIGWKKKPTLSNSWYLVILWTGLINAEEMELASPCLLCTSCVHTARRKKN